MKLFSIIVPVYNVENFLVECIDSVVGQNYNGYELILINDGSTDQSGRICDTYKIKHSQVKVIHKKNEGLAEARNTGIKNARGKYIIFLDGDDFLLDGSLEKIDHYLSLHGDSDMVLSHLIRLYNNKTRVEDAITYGTDELFHIHGLDNMAWLVKKGNMIWSSSATIYRREFIIDNHIYYPKGITCAEDLDFYFQAVLSSQVIRVYNDAFICYRVGRHGSIMTKKSEESIYDTMFIYRKWFYRINDMTANEESKTTVCQMLSKEYIKKLHNIGSFGIKHQKRLVKYAKKDWAIINYKTNNPLIKRTTRIYNLLGIRVGAIALHKYYRIKKKLYKNLQIKEHKGHEI